MAYWGQSSAQQVIRIPGMSLFRAKRRFTVASWAIVPSLASTVSLVRQNNTFTPLQADSGQAQVRSAWWTGAGSLQFIAGFGVFSEWCLFVTTFGGSVTNNFIFRPSLGTVTAGATTGVDPGGTTYVTPSVSFQPLCIGGTESNTELMPNTFAVAEISVFDWSFVERDVRQLAANPASLRDQMAMYIPLREPRRYTEPARGGQYWMDFGATSRAGFRPNQHPPVPLLGDF